MSSVVVRKALGYVFAICCFLVLVCSCSGQKATVEDVVEDAGTGVFSYRDSCQHLVVKMSLEVPLGEDSISMLIRDSLIADFVLNARQPGYDPENTFSINLYDGDEHDVQALVDYYGKADYDFLLEQALSDYRERMQYLEEDTTMTAEEKAMISEEVPQWCFELNVQQTTDTLNFAVYQSQAYVYYGGAHGGVTGSGALTFDKSNGLKISQFLNPEAVNALQPLIRKGILHYYSECGETLTDSDLNERLLIEGNLIPLPVDAAYPNATADSLIFTYRQYEIACYADGMPSFLISTRDLAPYLAPAAKSLLDASTSGKDVKKQ